jgi:hypothetical protein
VKEVSVYSTVNAQRARQFSRYIGHHSASHGQTLPLTRRPTAQLNILLTQANWTLAASYYSAQPGNNCASTLVATDPKNTSHSVFALWCKRARVGNVINVHSFHNSRSALLRAPHANKGVVNQSVKLLAYTLTPMMKNNDFHQQQ